MPARQMTGDEVRHVIRAIKTLQDPELLTLKAHLMVEYLLGNLVAQRLGTRPQALPRLKFPHLSALAFIGTDRPLARETEAATIVLDDMRNRYAHEAIPRGINAAHERLVSHAGLPWPRSAGERLLVFKAALAGLITALVPYALEPVGDARFRHLSAEAWSRRPATH